MASLTVLCPRACSAPGTCLNSSAQSSQLQQHLLSSNNCLNRYSIPSLQISGLQVMHAWRRENIKGFCMCRCISE
ncbi:unnamed protein product [Malus baccata var. baccata]